ncbi:putative double-strand-break repair protein rad21 protein [Lasiodiplodia theobromae]|uniref:Cohesin subunit rad21 n=1 Tax=Lasiodiplodia theobromae TaxID=45133 RepID=A0A5N5DCQ4_9PEZI|nr:Double-strand-break repair protein rad21 protein [Lasiodiplodia theobromae]KAB2575529.1 Cohesin subunit rad21 [Lasiodiplodia theobromae]KAF4536326.1 Double-strand-break repair protein rad21 protein [Lasiodiplodia theobromae]KAF9630785.1 putative double-strand-break repair protein rad21 protein [Lasiodiplodia theobromae]
MFYSETLLSKTGPLARVWLAANLERKLSKSNILQSNIETSVNAIVDQGQAPMALRLSGQLLLGVVRIYSRKARYLLDDCNEALMKIKLAFRPGNVDLPVNQAQSVNPASLTLPDVLTELDLLAPMPDPSLLLSQEPEIETGRRDPTLLDPPSQYLLDTQDRQAQETLQLGDDDLYLDISEGPDITMDRSIEVGRDAPLPRPASEEVAPSPKPLEDDGLELDFAEDSVLPLTDLGRRPSIGDDDIAMGGVDDEPAAPEEDQPRAPTPLEEEQAAEDRRRESASPLSSARSSVARELEETFHFDQENTVIEPEEEFATAPQRVKRRKILQADADTEFSQSQFKAQMNDHTKILKQPEFLPRDPMLLALMNMQKSGGFVSSILGEGRSQGWAPELRGILSLEVVRRSGELKRKRGAAAAIDGLEQDQDGRVPQLEIPDESGFDLSTGAGLDAGGDTTLNIGQEEELGNVPARERTASVEPVPEDDEQPMSPLPGDNFDDTTMPLLHPEDAGPISVGTRHAVHILREKFGPEAESSPGARQKNSVLFQDMLPEATTTKADATKMFFECLVLATKDAVKVEQKTDELGAPIRVRAKRGLWGDWAEMSAGGEIANQTQPQEVAAAA